MPARGKLGHNDYDFIKHVEKKQKQWNGIWVLIQ